MYGIYFFSDPNRNWKDVSSGIWLVVYIAFMLIVSKLGTFGGLKIIPDPWDEFIVIAASIPFYYWAVASGHPTKALDEAYASPPSQEDAVSL